jgi:hypothetical protein
MHETHGQGSENLFCTLCCVIFFTLDTENVVVDDFQRLKTLSRRCNVFDY